MSQYQHLLLIINPALRHSPAISQAAALAKASGASLHIAALIKWWDFLSLLEEGDRARARAAYLQDHHEWLASQAASLRAEGLRVTTEVGWSEDMKREILDHVTVNQPDLLIKEEQHESLLKRALFTPLDWQLLRDCPVPVYLLGAAGPGLPRKVVAAVDVAASEDDGGALNDRIVEQATSFATQFGAELHLLYAYDVSQNYLEEVVNNWTVSELMNARRQELQVHYSALARKFGVMAEHRHSREGHPVAAISEFAEEHDVDVIVMGRVQRHGLEKLLGSTTEHILYQVPCSVLAV
ncbi:universal stress protein [Pseudomonas glycinis]